MRNLFLVVQVKKFHAIIIWRRSEVISFRRNRDSVYIICIDRKDLGVLCNPKNSTFMDVRQSRHSRSAFNVKDVYR